MLIQIRLISELREGSKVLVDQLGLMDEKYLDLRSKLDVARSQQRAMVEKAQKEAADLRKQIAMLNVPIKLKGVSSAASTEFHCPHCQTVSKNGVVVKEGAALQFARSSRSALSMRIEAMHGSQALDR